MFNMHEWAQLQFGCVNGREAEAFILVYDVSVPLTFKYIQVLREQVGKVTLITTMANRYLSSVRLFPILTPSPLPIHNDALTES